MQVKLRIMRFLIGLGGALLIAMPGSAFAHDNIGGDELAAANWMLIAAMVTVVMGVLAGIWAWKAGQFTNIEESKYRMLDTADDYDAIMAESAPYDAPAHKNPRSTKPASAGSAPTGSPAVPANANAADRAAHV